MVSPYLTLLLYSLLTPHSTIRILAHRTPGVSTTPYTTVCSAHTSVASIWPVCILYIFSNHKAPCYTMLIACPILAPILINLFHRLRSIFQLQRTRGQRNRGRHL